MELASHYGENERQIRRHIRLTYLIPKILDMVDEGKIAFTIVELSYQKSKSESTVTFTNTAYLPNEYLIIQLLNSICRKDTDTCFFFTLF